MARLVFHHGFAETAHHAFNHALNLQRQIQIIHTLQRKARHPLAIFLGDFVIAFAGRARHSVRAVFFRATIRGFWADEYAGYDERFKREAIAPIQNKIGQFLLNPVVRNILGQVKKKVDIPFMMDDGRLFIANLSKGQLGHDKANLLGSLLVTQFQLGAMARSNRPESERRDFYLFIDEFQNFSTDAFASILAEARKYWLCLTLSHQYIDQLPEPIRKAVFGNVGTLVAFRIGYTDAEAMAKEFGNAVSPAALVVRFLLRMTGTRQLQWTQKKYRATWVPVPSPRGRGPG